MKKTFIIAEIGQAHEGSLGILHSYIDAVSKTGVDAIKFQTHIAEAESSVHEPFRVKFSYEDNTRMDYWKRMEFSSAQWAEIKEHCDKCDIEFMSSPFSCAAVELLDSLGMKKFKVGSGEVSNFLLLEKIKQTGKKILLSSGMSSFDELDKTIDFLKSAKERLSLFQCTTSYPTLAKRVGLNVIPEMKQRYSLPIGLSDHSGTIYPSLAASAIGAELIEVHVTFDKRMFGPDTSSSLTIDELKDLVDGIRFNDEVFNNQINKNDLTEYLSLKSIFEKSLCVNKKIPKGHILTFSDLESKKPANFGIACNEYEKVIGRSINKNMNQYDFLKEEDLEPKD